MIYQKYCYIKRDNTTFNDILMAIEKNGIGAVVLVDESFHLVGLVTDGDVRRCILSDTKDIDRLINYTPDTWHYSKSRKGGINHLKKTHNNILPVVNDENIVVDIIYLNEINFNFIDNYVVLMAGGLGTRLMPLTKDTPKPLLPINGKPILERILEKLIEQGFHNFYISINYLGDKIRDYFGDGSRWEVNIKYIEEDKRLGTAGALYKLRDEIDKSFLVMNGDIITDFSFRELLDYHLEEQNFATMSVYEKNYRIPFGVVEFNSKREIISLVEKPLNKYYINMGIYALEPKALEYIPKDSFFDMPTLFQNLVDMGKRCGVYIFDGIWNDVGHLEDYNQVNFLMKKV